MARKVIAMLLAATILTLTACGGSSSGSAPASEAPAAEAQASDGAHATTKDTLVIRLDQDPGMLDNVGGTLSRAEKICGFTSNSMLNNDFDADGKKVLVVDPRYSLLENYTIADDSSSIELNIRKGVKFHNGEELKANDIVFSICRYEGVSRMSFIDFSDVKAVDDYTVHVGLLEPNASAMSSIGTYMDVYNEKAFKSASSEGAAVQSEYVGTGPYKLVKWVSGDSIELERFDDYFGGKPAFKKVIIRFIPEATVAMMEMETGGVDIIDLPAATDVANVKAGDYQGQVKYSEAIDNLLYFGFDCSEGSICNDLRVRQAICYAIGRDEIQYGAFDGIGYVPYHVFSAWFEGIKEYKDSWPYERDVEKAKALLKEAGIEGEQTLVLIHNGTAEWALAAQILDNQLSEIGIHLDIQGYDSATYNSIMLNETDKWDVFLRTAGSASQFLTNIVLSSAKSYTHATPEGTEGYGAMAELAEAAATEMNLEKHTALEAEIQDRWLQECDIMYPLVMTYAYTLYADNLQDMKRVGNDFRCLDAYFD